MQPAEPSCHTVLGDLRWRSQRSASLHCSRHATTRCELSNEWGWLSWRLRYTVGPVMRAPSGRVMSQVSHPFERFASECELGVTVEAVSAVPRDVLRHAG